MHGVALPHSLPLSSPLVGAVVGVTELPLDHYLALSEVASRGTELQTHPLGVRTSRPLPMESRVPDNTAWPRPPHSSF